MFAARYAFMSDKNLKLRYQRGRKRNQISHQSIGVMLQMEAAQQPCGPFQFALRL